MARLFESITIHMHRDDEPCPAWRATPEGVAAATPLDAALARLVDEWGTLGVLHKLVDPLERADALAVVDAYLRDRSVRDLECGPACSEGHTYVNDDTSGCSLAGRSEPEDATKVDGARMSTLPQPGVPTMNLLADEPVWSLRRIYEALEWRATDHNTVRALDMLRWHVEHGEATAVAAADIVVDAVVEGEFTDAQAAMIVGLVAVLQATGATHMLGHRGLISKAADLVREARDSTPGWDEGDLLVLLGLVTR